MKPLYHFVLNSKPYTVEIPQVMFFDKDKDGIACGRAWFNQGENQVQQAEHMTVEEFGQYMGGN